MRARSCSVCSPGPEPRHFRPAVRLASPRPGRRRGQRQADVPTRSLEPPQPTRRTGRARKHHPRRPPARILHRPGRSLDARVEHPLRSDPPPISGLRAITKQLERRPLRRHDRRRQQFRKTCQCKWAFNVKPDLVIQTPTGKLLCIEAKWDSAEGSYPASEREKAIFQRRGIPHLPQTSVQRYLDNEVLGFDGTFAYLARRRFETAAGRGITWTEALTDLDRTGAPPFIDEWCAAVTAI